MVRPGGGNQSRCLCLGEQLILIQAMINAVAERPGYLDKSSASAPAERFLSSAARRSAAGVSSLKTNMAADRPMTVE